VQLHNNEYKEVTAIEIHELVTHYFFTETVEFE